MDLLNKTGVPIKYSGDGLSHKDINDINTTTNSCVDGVNYCIKDYCNINVEINDPDKTMTLKEAITLVPLSRRNFGMKVRFLDIENGLSYSEYVYSGTVLGDEDWNNLNNWGSVINFIDGGEWDVEIEGI